MAVARAGKFLDDDRDRLAVTATRYPQAGATRPAILLYDVAALAARRPAMGDVVVPALAEGVAPVPLFPPDRQTGYGQRLAGGVDLTGDGRPELLVSAPGASVASEGGGAVYGYLGGLPAGAPPELALLVVGDVAERGQLGQSLSLAPGDAMAAPLLVLGAPGSYRVGTQSGTAFLLPLRF
jgi:hypothetical protein